MNRRFARAVAVCAALAGLPAPAAAIDFEAAKVRAAAAQQQAAEGQWDAASGELTTALGQCPPDKDGRSCRLLLEFNLGYLYQRWGAAAPQRRGQLLKESVAAYRSVLNEMPTHPETISNLALVLETMGRSEELRALLEQVRVGNPNEAAQISVLIGDERADAGDWAHAYAGYAAAADLAPGQDAPRRKLIEAYGKVAAGGADLPDRLRDWELRSPDAAADGYRAVVLARAADDAAAAERALLRWVAVTAEQRALSADLVARQYPEPRFPPIGALKAYLTFLQAADAPPLFSMDNYYQYYFEGQQCDGTSGWWTETPLRRQALAQAALAAGRASVVAQQPEIAEKQFLAGLRCSPHLEEYIYGNLKGEPFVPLDLYTELAWLQFRYPTLDRDGSKLNLYIEILFEGKAEAYQARDLEAIQRHHTVLAEIFVAKGVWEGSGARNAMFQLTHAITTAETRRKEEGIYEPLARLRALLADRCATIGDEKCKSAAHQTTAAAYLAAAQASLDSDELKDAGAMLERARGHRADAKLREAIGATEQILATRRTPQGALGPSVPVWMSKPSMGGLDDEFLHRQQFKAYADLARAGEGGAAAAMAQAAMAKARQLSALVGTADLLRVERAATLAAGATSRRPKIEFLVPGKSGPAWWLALPSAEAPVRVQLPQE